MLCGVGVGDVDCNEQMDNFRYLLVCVYDGGSVVFDVQYVDEEWMFSVRMEKISCCSPH